MARFDTSEVQNLARDLGQARLVAQRQGRAVVQDAAKRVVEDWQRNAREIDLPHGKLYPRTIGFDGPRGRGGIWTASVGPDSTLPQGGMGRGFEYGSINQDTPHLEGNRAADAEMNRFAWSALDWGFENLRWHIRDR